MIDEKNMAYMIQDIRDYIRGKATGIIWSTAQWLEFADTIESHLKENAELKKIKGLCLPGGCVHISPDQFEKLEAVARVAQTHVDYHHDEEAQSLRDALAALEEKP